MPELTQSTLKAIFIDRSYRNHYEEISPAKKRKDLEDYLLMLGSEYTFSLEMIGHEIIQ